MSEVDPHHRVERLSHALYGLIIITAGLVAESKHVDEAGEALTLLLTTALVLLLAHTYSAYMAERAVEGKPLGRAKERLVVADNVPVLAAIVVPGALFVAVGIGWIELSFAYAVSISFTILTLFGLGVYEARLAGMSGVRILVGGIGAAAIGLLVVAVEALFD